MWHKFSRSINFTYALFAARALMEDRVDSGPCDQWFEHGSDACDAATSPAKEKTCGNIVPHGRNIGRFCG